MTKPTKTINQIHFEDISPARFEDMCLQVVYRMRSWGKIDHYGRAGKDGAIDIYTELSHDGTTESWVIQCKRYKSIKQSELIKIIDDFISKNKKFPDKYVLIISCDLTRAKSEKFVEYAKEKGLSGVEIVTSSILETILYSKHPDLLYVFFGIDLINRRSTTVAKLKRRLTMKREVEKNSRSRLFEHDILIRDVHRDIYPEQEFNSPGISPWFKVEFFRTYHKGISFYIHIDEVLVNKKTGNWKLSTGRETASGDWIKINALTVGNIPYDNIVDIDYEGDEYYRYPHIYCEFSNLGEPYEEVWYMPTDDYKSLVDSLPREMQVK